MTITVEDGSNVTGAESFASVSQFDTYHANRGNTLAATLITAEKEQALRRATDFIQQRYRSYWKGYKKYATQSLSWPRTFVYSEPVLYGDTTNLYPQLIADDIVPTEVINACIELAFRGAAGDLFPDVTDLVTEETIGPITTKYDKRSPVSPIYKAIDAMLAVYLKDGGMNSATITVQRS